jgi:hypothetical protein
MKRLPVLTAIILVCLLAGARGAVAQLRDPSEPSSVFPREVIRVGDPVSVTLCHIPPGNPANAQTIEVAPAAVAEHLAHGDLLGECPYECNCLPAPVQQTDQSQCWNQHGTPIACAGTGQDGEYQYGVSVDPRFTDNGDGTVTDNLTGLIWLKDANCFGNQVWLNALSEVNTLADGSCGLTDGSVAGDWRLPNVKELQSLIDFGHWAPALPPGHPFSGVQLFGYWSSTTFADYTGGAWLVNLLYGDVYYGIKTYSPGAPVWAVRGGQ